VIEIFDCGQVQKYYAVIIELRGEHGDSNRRRSRDGDGPLVCPSQLRTMPASHVGFLQWGA